MKLAVRILGVSLIAMLVFVFAGVIATWAPDRSVAQLSARWARAPSQFVSVAGMQVHLRDEGPRNDPNPIVLLHGTAASLHTWDGWAQNLTATRRVIRFDLPAFGLTGPHPQNDYSMAAYVQFVQQVLDSLGLQHVVLGGNSLGGQIAWEFALAQPLRVTQLILVDAGGYPMQSQSVPLGFRLARAPVLGSLMEYTLPRGVIQSSVRNVYGDPAKVTAELVDRYYELTLRAGNRAALVQRFGQMRWDHVEQIKTLKLPTLILWGAQDRLIPLDNGRHFAADIAGAHLVVFEQLGHVPQEEDAQSTVHAVKEFLKIT
ncbi:alpha/beta hydrolase [Rhodoferax saidenbachensis]|uniref:Pimeloyl-ACP methyl ester carboxylesterase n=1 Tax=Rhodoferax saidenbachensis TaxID=1484693 RepID=A0ABU1ZPT3_9BURK|nr:alpha/beta hydrolase [Rhodoferax saidenbachensis]MDR7307558.1 pimeloyl-ACP methyl ester carboxylesterase [Rhodoferax saidenbachensis]